MQDIVPGDTFRMSSEVFLRFAPLTAPIMQNIDVFVHFFFVPYRLIWDDWEEFITAGEDGMSAPELPNISYSAIPKEFTFNGTLADYLGIPTDNDTLVNEATQTISLLPFRAYQLIYNEYYRDQNVTEEVEFSKESGNFDDLVFEEVEKLMSLRYRAWEKDMFTSALPTPQRGPDVLIPVRDSEIDLSYDVTGKTLMRPVTNPQQPASVIKPIASTGLQSNASVVEEDSYYVSQNDGTSNRPVGIDNTSNIKATLNALNATLTDFRTAMKVQELLELSARVGSRYVEQLLGFFGVKSSDARLQRPEYLGGGRAPIIVSDVVQQSSTNDTSVLGDLAGKGVAMARANTFKRYFEEHGLLIGILSIRPRSTYMDGLPKYWTKRTRFDFYFPQFAHLGEQEVKKSEVRFMNTASTEANNDKVFGYTPRYAEYKYIPSSVHGDFRDSLLPWHLARKFTGIPALNTRFIEVRPEYNNRIFAVMESGEEPYNQKVWIQVYNRIKAKRPMPKFGTPHF